MPAIPLAILLAVWLAACGDPPPKPSATIEDCLLQVGSDFVDLRQVKAFRFHTYGRMGGTWLQPEGMNQIEIRIEDKAEIEMAWRRCAVLARPLTAEQVIRIRTSGKRGIDLARELGVAESTISEIRSCKWRKHG